jgi:EpsI family protein
LFNYRFAILNSILLLAVLGSHFGRRVEGAVVVHKDFLDHISMPFRGWQTKDVTLNKGDLALLQPDAVLVRRYVAASGPGNAEIAVIAGHKKKTVHTPGFCMVGDGWELLEQRTYDLEIGSRTIPCMRSLMVKDKQQLIATYFFTDGDFCTNNLLRFQAAQLLHRFRSEPPIGALVRTIVVMENDRQEAEKLSDDFARATVPVVLRNLREAKLKIE